MRQVKLLAGFAILMPLLTDSAVAQSGKQDVPPSDISRKGGTLSEKLNSTSGVISPEGTVDPGMQKAPSATGTMPVVPPPGTPGGNSDAVPK